ncbi:MAG TPA: TIGR00266 family protein [Polyangiaceae bacterium]|nr:TIGR00266 family protein [Polyangiaceae bacterium]
MQTFIEHGPAFAWLRVQLAPGETIRAEAGAMVRRTSDVQMETRLNAGFQPSVFRLIWAFLVALMRKVLGNETMFINDFSTTTAGEVVLAPTFSGNITQKSLTAGHSLFVQTGGYLASTGSVDMRLRFGGLRSFFGGEGLVLLECSGQGDVFVNSYGGVVAVPVNGKFIVDTGHIVAFDGSLDFRVRSVGGAKSFFFSGEGLVCEFNGQGTVYIQSRNVNALVGWLTPLLPG